MLLPRQAKLLYPDVPIECVLSVGTGYYAPKLSESGMGWPTVIAQLINSATVSFGCIIKNDYAILMPRLRATLERGFMPTGGGGYKL